MGYFRIKYYVFGFFLSITPFFYQFIITVFFFFGKHKTTFTR